MPTWKDSRMFWMVLCVSMTISSCHEPVSSISDAVRMGATLVSRFLNPTTPSGLSSIFAKITKEMKVNQKEAAGNEFILFLLNLMGVDSQKITEFAFDGLISVLRLMNDTLVQNGGSRRKGTMGSLFRFVLSQPKVAKLLPQMQDPNLIDLILKQSEEKLKHYPEEDTDCIKALICRTKPFVREMQRSLRFFMNRENIQTSGCEGTCYKGDNVSWDAASLEDRMYFFVPTMKIVVESGDECDRLFPNCVY